MLRHAPLLPNSLHQLHKEPLCIPQPYITLLCLFASYILDPHIDVLHLQSIAPALRTFLSPCTTACSSPLLGMLTRMLTLSMWTGIEALDGETLPYNAMRLAVWAASNMGLAVGAHSDVALYHPFKQCHASFNSLPTRCPLIFSAAVAARCLQLPLSPAAIYLPVRQDACCNSFPCYCRSIALLSMSAQVGAKTQELCGCVCLGGATTSSRSSSKIALSSS